MFDSQRALRTVVTGFALLMATLYASTILHLWKSAPQHLLYVETILNTFVALALLFFFNPLRSKSSISAIEKRLIFMGALIILINTSMFQFIKSARSDLIAGLRARVAAVSAS